MKKLSFYMLLVCVVATLASCKEQKEEPDNRTNAEKIIGKWELVKYEENESGAVEEISLVMFRSYREDGTMLDYYPEDEEYEEEYDFYTYEWTDDDSMVETMVDNDEFVYYAEIKKLTKSELVVVYEYYNEEDESDYSIYTYSFKRVGDPDTTTAFEDEYDPNNPPEIL